MNDLKEIDVQNYSAEQLREHITLLEDELYQVKRSEEIQKNSTEAAFAKLREVAQQFDTYKTNAEQKLLYCKNAVANLNQSIILIGKGDN